MNIIFAGPTISHERILQHLDCLCLPPVRHGDILSCLSRKPVALGIIDGYFEGAPSVWHKEILYALEQGVHVYGASSMGALRAAELHPFGMQGIGQIFAWYRDDIITDDDEVAVLHGPAETNFLQASEPLVNIRATLALARQQALIDDGQHEQLVNRAKSTYYKQRSWGKVLESAQDIFTDPAELDALALWLHSNKTDLKQQDAVELLATMHARSADHASQYQPEFHFEWTNVWDAAFEQYGGTPTYDRQISHEERHILDQLRLQPERYEHYRDKALISWLAENMPPTNHQATELKQEIDQFRKANNLRTQAQLMNYLDDTELTETRLTKLLQNVAQVTACRASAGDLGAVIIGQLKLDGGYLELRSIVREKQHILHEIDAEANSDDEPLAPAQILAWYFADRLGTTIPNPLIDHLHRVDLATLDDFYRLITVDYHYWQQHS